MTQAKSTSTSQQATKARSTSTSQSKSSSSAQSQKTTSTAKKATSSTSGHKYVTVKAGQGMFRVAYNNGLTTAQLMQMNGLTSSSQLYPGQQLRVR
ncbi:LysM peptidoglycan-binding domain-containing protein [Lentilactobacillus parabuchneri]|uniref:LysM peptidoglycan-binding domain-containing protein n=1 Tax=Lentilactobacillus parabuchneri TaxID=152331 RepID=UPI001EFE4CB7|nr:LysM domain-containing protein [Lentilactobacillus parabuchneri]